MSGIVGIVNLNGAPVDRVLLRRMTEFMAFRGPDALEIWTDGPVGFGHAMLRTTRESLGERQPYSLDGRVWITADARVDGRADLISKLQSEVREDLEGATDVELILHAYQAWEQQCVQHLLGDFAFAIWDGRRKRLFCARDHFGVKPFYYAHVRGCLIFSNTLNGVRQHPDVSDGLNDLAIADFLLFDRNQDPATTTFADVQRLPAAHCLTWSGEGLHLSRYWTLPIDGHIRYKRAGDYVEHFRALFRTAVGDRLRTDRVGISMSGGLDSTTVAATAHGLLSERSAAFDLRAYTSVCDRLIPDQERKYSGLVAQALDIPIHYLVTDDYLPYERLDEPELCAPEPSHHPRVAIVADYYRQLSPRCRVLLTGYGGDPALYYHGDAYIVGQLKGLHWLRLATEIGECIFVRRQIPIVGFRTTLKRWLGKPAWRPPCPGWLQPDFASRLDLPARWEQMNAPATPLHPIRPEAYEKLTDPYWQVSFEKQDPGVTFFPVEVRHPFFDVRLLNYLLAIPPIPWAVRKELLREAMRDALPEAVRLRPKTPLRGEPYFERLRNCGSQWWSDHFDPAPELVRYVDIDAVPRGAGGDPNELWLNLRPLSLNNWFRASKFGRLQTIQKGAALCSQRIKTQPNYPTTPPN